MGCIASTTAARAPKSNTEVPVARLCQLVLVGTLAGCAAHDNHRWEQIDWDVGAAEPGDYTGELRVHAKAKVGPVIVANETCSNDAEVRMNAIGQLNGTLSCDFGGDIGHVGIDLHGASFAMPLMGGTLDAEVNGEPVSFDWSGGFTSDTAFFGETDGKKSVQGATVLFNGWFEIERMPTAPGR